MEDDFASSFEALDLARVLYEKKLQEPEEGEGKGKSTGDSPMTMHYKERLGETHDLLAEISLENERFPGAVADFRSSLGYKMELNPEESEIIAEAHFKLSLALEFASINQTKEEGEDEGADNEKEQVVDQAMRDEAMKELELAIKSTTLKLQNKEVELASSHSPEDNDITREQIADVKGMIAELEGRLAELKGPLLDVKNALYGADANPMGGILSAILGESPVAAAARIEEAKKKATDVSSLIRKKEKKPVAESNGTATNGNGKRKIEDGEGDSEAKKAKVKDTAEQ